MNTRTLSARSALSSLLALALLAGSLAPAALAQRRRKPVVVTFGQPNIWSLEQAHYLLARMHQTNLDLKARELADDDLDPNAVNGTRINLLKQLLEAGVTFDQGVGFQNQLITRNAQFNSNRQLELTADQDRQQSDLLRLTRDHAQFVRERALLDADPTATKADKDKKDAEVTASQAEIDAVKAKISFNNDELKTLGAAPSGTPVSPDAVPTPFDKTRLPSSLLDSLTGDKLLDLAKDPKLNASTILDNHVQMQYEIIAKQLTLLRDEVGPGERLVFLELPQSIYTSPGDGDEKMAQTWWHVNGYTKTDPLVRLLLELLEVEQKWHDIQQVQAYQDREADLGLVVCDEKARKALDAAHAQVEESAWNKLKDDTVGSILLGLKCERELARRRVLENLYREADGVFARVEQNGARDTSDLVDAIRKVISVQPDQTADRGEDGAPRKSFVDARGPLAADAKLIQSPSLQTESARRTKVLELKQTLLAILSEDSPMEPKGKDDKETREKEAKLQKFKTDFGINDGSEFERGIEFIRLDDNAMDKAGNANIERRTVRTVDIIPRQSSLNVNDLNDTVKAFGLWGSFKFLFGLGGQTSFQRQREQFDQFIHQELFASGFGKGDRDFGWTFGALPGTKRVSPGIRTTYAVLVVPDDAESLVLSARGCYFPRHDKEPLDYADTADSHWDHTGRNCGDAQTYIIPVPGGGDTSNFWVTNVDYQNAPKGTRATVSVRGNNFSSQIGVLVDGVPLAPDVGLAQPLLRVAHKGLDDKCAAATSICGDFERIDPEQVVFSFSMPKDKDGNDYEGTPTITLVAPGKSTDLNSLTNLRINRDPNRTLGDKDVALMFGDRPGDPKLGITDLKVFRVGNKAAPHNALALLSGTKFDADTEVMINGVPAAAPPAGLSCAVGANPPCKELKSEKLLRLFFDLPRHGEDVTVTLLSKDGKTLATKTLANPLALKISSVTKISYEPPNGKKSKGVLVVKLEGTGLDAPLLLFVNDVLQPSSNVLSQSANEAVIRLINPDPAVVVKLMNAETKDAASAVVTREATGANSQ